MTRLGRLCAPLASLILAGTAVAADPGPGQARPLVEDPALEERVNRLSEELRCLVCQNQTIADSHAGLALDLKREIREQLRAGRSPEQVRGHMVERYGDFILYRPPLKPSTTVLWLGPFLLLAGGVWVLRRAVAPQRVASAAPSPAAPPSAED